MTSTPTSRAPRFPVPGRTTRSFAFATGVVTLVSGLRAASDGPMPSATIIATAVAALTVLVRPMTRQRRGFPVVLTAMIVSTLALRALFLLAQTGRLSHGGPVGWLCSPAAAPGADPSGPCRVVAHGGSGLLVAQLAAVVLLAAAITGLERHIWDWTLLTTDRIRGAAAGLLTTIGTTGAVTTVAGSPPVRRDLPTWPTFARHIRDTTPRRGPPAR